MRTFVSRGASIFSITRSESLGYKIGSVLLCFYRVLGQSDGTEQATLVSGPGAASGPLPPGRTFGRGFPQPKSTILRRFSTGGPACGPRVRRSTGQMRFSPLVEQRSILAGALSGKRD